jgi:hypothetical protein
VNKETLRVPAHIQSMESELKKEWNKKERQAKQALKKQTENTPKTSTKGTKRKAGDAQPGPGTHVNLNLTFSLNSGGAVEIAQAEPAAKKSKTTSRTTSKAKKSVADKEVDPVRKKTSKKEPTLEKGAASLKTTTKPTAGPSSQTSVPTPSVPQKIRRRQVARASTSGVVRQSTSQPAPALEGSSPPRPIQYARRGGKHSNPSSRQYSMGNGNDSDNDNDDPPPPYPGSPGDSDEEGYNSPLGGALGLLNGRYEVRCLGEANNSGIIFTLDGKALWGSFEIGPLSGILRLQERPWQPSHERLSFRWRAEDEQGGRHDQDGEDDGSYIKFLGGGNIRGEIAFYNSMIEFDGHRTSGAATRSEIDASSMRRQWDELEDY